MHPAGRLIHYLWGSPAHSEVSVEIPTLYDSEAVARSEVGVVMTLSRMVHGDRTANTTSWYLLTVKTAQFPLDNLDDVFIGYQVDSTFYPVAGGWTATSLAAPWVAFIGELESQRASEASLPWSRSMLAIHRIADVERIDLSYFRFAPWGIELVVRPLHICVTEPLF
ncbi:hypothetical protein C6A86_023535 [Mycobacterium sp. ITM-2016-00316]|uniref:hypothetical protein n=1 Tax=Mycobacterium sp. ITM-2016-00316 TaxID=2099695 RepID=UPI000CF9C352|nr:hypothetical protein [Mycobacterium sp. ITM-2016-00316]WNG81134.1 hypothetical protein C6A86_023535 [Mycobacterium sp. ITM-2016-00316]